MNDDKKNMPPRLAEIVTDFQFCRGREKLEYLLEFAESLRPLPAWLEERRDEMDQVNECMTPVLVFAEQTDGILKYHFMVPDESPTVRGFAAVLQQGVQGLSPEAVLAVPNDFYLHMGLQDVLSGQRMNGMAAILAYMKRLATENLNKEQPTS